MRFAKPRNLLNFSIYSKLENSEQNKVFFHKFIKITNLCQDILLPIQIEESVYYPSNGLICK